MRFVGLALKARQPAAGKSLRRFVAHAMVEHLVRLQFGKSYWLDTLPPSKEAFLEADIEGDPIPLPERYDRLRQSDGFSDSDERRAFRRITRAKSAALGSLTAAVFTAPELWRVWTAAAGDESRGAGEALRHALREDAATDEGHAFDGVQPLARGEELVEGLWRGWIGSGSYRTGFGREAFADGDADGLPAYLERIFGTEDDAMDTDGDGWSDLAEILEETEPDVAGDKPSAIGPDGQFGDWLDLLPERIHGDKGHSQECPKAADITHVGALASRDELIIGGFARNFEDHGPKARWEAVLDFPRDEKQLRVTAGANQRVYTLEDPETDDVLKRFRRAFPLGREVSEVAFERQALGLKKHWNQDDAVRVRLRTVYEPEDDEARFCDESKWFSAAISR